MGEDPSVVSVLRTARLRQADDQPSPALFIEQYATHSFSI